MNSWESVLKNRHWLRWSSHLKTSVVLRFSLDTSRPPAAEGNTVWEVPGLAGSPGGGGSPKEGLSLQHIMPQTQNRIKVTTFRTDLSAHGKNQEAQVFADHQQHSEKVGYVSINPMMPPSDS